MNYAFCMFYECQIWRSKCEWDLSVTPTFKIKSGFVYADKNKVCLLSSLRIDWRNWCRLLSRRKLLIPNWWMFIDLVMYTYRFSNYVSDGTFSIRVKPDTLLLRYKKEGRKLRQQFVFKLQEVRLISDAW